MTICRAVGAGDSTRKPSNVGRAVQAAKSLRVLTAASGTQRTFAALHQMNAIGGIADIAEVEK